MSTRFDVGQACSFWIESQRVHGRVTRLRRRRRAILTDDNRRFLVPVDRLRAPPRDVLLLETRLDGRLSSPRQQGAFLQHLFRVQRYAGQVLYERVHSKADFAVFLKSARRRSGVRFIHYAGHGEHHPGSGRVELVLTHEMINLADAADRRVFAGLAYKVLIFSCCEIGRAGGVMQRLADESKATVICYHQPVSDAYANTAEMLMYDLFQTTGRSPRDVVRTVSRALVRMGIQVLVGGEPLCRGPILCCYVPRVDGNGQ